MLKIRLMNEGRCDERLKTRVEESTCLTYTGLYDKNLTVYRIQIGMFRPIRLDHTNCLQVAIQTHQLSLL